MAKPIPTTPLKQEVPPTQRVPVREQLGVEKVGAGWVVVATQLQGDKVLSEKVLSYPGKAVQALEAFKVELAKRALR